MFLEVGTFEGMEGVDEADGAGEEDGMSLETGGITQGDGQVSFSEADSANEDDIGALVDEVELEEELDLGLVDGFGPAPVKVRQGFDHGKARGLDPALGAMIEAALGFAGDQLAQIILMGGIVLGGFGRQFLVVLTEESEFEVFELIVE
ncbi:MAG: hypothetical protein A2Z16_11085 [Chloroflexi bacterium RBG_16_54_18]|nr:MAG: hypothetical protein A2Z16_11085 [Chloroflexi bacterium RBG_16_54_18]